MKCVSLITLLLALASGTFGAEPAIESLVARSENGGVSVRLNLAHAFDRQEIGTALQSGLPTGFTYEIELIRKRPNWFDDEVATATIEIICTFNSLTQEYLLNYRRDRRLVRSEVIRDLPSLMQTMTNIDEERLFETGKYRPQKLVIRARARLLQSYLLYVVPWKETTPWKQVRVQVPRQR